jgi:hypothetical protein
VPVDRRSRVAARRHPQRCRGRGRAGGRRGAWITGLGLLGAAYLGQLPPWVKARGLSYYLVAFQGANAIGALVLGGIAQATSPATALTVLAVTLLVAVPLTWRLAFPAAVADAPPTEKPLTLPEIQTVEEGPVAITISYRLAPGRADAFLAQAAELRRTRPGRDRRPRCSDNIDRVR